MHAHAGSYGVGIVGRTVPVYVLTRCFPSFLLLSGPNSFVTRHGVNAVMPYIGPANTLINKYPRAIKCESFRCCRTYALKYAVGMKMDLGRFIRIGERSHNVERAVNAKFGVNASCDTPPKRRTDAPEDPGDPKTKVPLETMKKTYYEARGWAATVCLAQESSKAGSRATPNRREAV